MLWNYEIQENIRVNLNVFENLILDISANMKHEIYSYKNKGFV